MDNPIPIFTDISQVYPNIENQLCNRHTILLSALANKFKLVYKIDPCHITSVKALANIIKTPTLSLTLPLQNGATMLSSKTLANDCIYLNGLGEEIIFTTQGKITTAQNNALYSHLGQVVELVYEDIPVNKRKGAILLLHMNIMPQAFNYSQCLSLALFIALSVVNQSKNTVQEIIQQISNSGIMGDQSSIRKYFTYEHSSLLLSIQNQFRTVPINKKYRFVICQVPQKTNNKQYSQLNKQIKTDYGVQSIYALQNVQKEQQKEYLQYQYNMLQILKCLTNQNTTLQDTINKITVLNKQEIQQITAFLPKRTCMMVDNKHILIVCYSHNYIDVLTEARKFIQMKPKVQYLEKRFSSDKTLPMKLFANGASKAIAVLDPAGSIWFQ